MEMESLYLLEQNLGSVMAGGSAPRCSSVIVGKIVQLTILYWYIECSITAFSNSADLFTRKYVCIYNY